MTPAGEAAGDRPANASDGVPAGEAASGSSANASDGGTVVPYAQTLGAARDGGGWRMAFAPGLIGAPERLHGGALAGFLELVAIDAVRAAAGAGATCKPVSVTVDFLRAGALADVFGRAEITRLGRRVANVRAVAWQEAPDKPVAAAHLNVLISRA